MPCPGRRPVAATRSAKRVVALRAQRGDHLLLGGPGGQVLADDAGEDHVGRHAEDLGPEDAHHDADDRQGDDRDQDHPLGRRGARAAASARAGS